MSVTKRAVSAPPESVFAELSDGWVYATWVVGASRIRDVDEAWPALGSRIHHSVGVWPLVIDDSTEVREMVPARRIRLRARAWPAGEADVTIDLEPAGTGTMVTITEDVASGPGRLVPSPLRNVLLDWRNRETLKRLAYLSENRSPS
jgi:uncharacterized protein YndB with AHSA1/START domain